MSSVVHIYRIPCLRDSFWGVSICCLKCQKYKLWAYKILLTFSKIKYSILNCNDLTLVNQDEINLRLEEQSYSIKGVFVLHEANSGSIPISSPPEPSRTDPWAQSQKPWELPGMAPKYMCVYVCYTILLNILICRIQDLLLSSIIISHIKNSDSVFFHNSMLFLFSRLYFRHLPWYFNIGKLIDINFLKYTIFHYLSL